MSAGEDRAPDPDAAGYRDHAAARLTERLRRAIEREGALPVHAFMQAALTDPEYGYYAALDPIGAGGDFVTAPEVSQIFGEVIGLWLVESWRAMGEPAEVELIELGPGKGTLAADILRTARVAPDFLAALRLTLVEASPALQMVQARTLQASPVPVRWTRALDRPVDRPWLLVANEFLDCLPPVQVVRAGGLWRERVVALDPDDPERFVFALGGAASPWRQALIPEALRDAPDGALFEIREADRLFVEALGARLLPRPGRALFIDYGPAEPELGDTLQAVRGHQRVDPLDRPGSADLTARVDFANLAAAGEAAGFAVAGPTPQGLFLKRLGAEHRAAALAAARPDARPRIARQLHRLADPDSMGLLFKAMALSAPGLPDPPGFDD